MTGLTSGSRAQVQVTLEILLSDNWSANTTVDQIVHQATESARGKVRDLVRGGARIIGDIRVTLIMADGTDR